MVTDFMHLQFSQERQTMCKWNERLEGQLQSANGTSNRQTAHIPKIMKDFSVEETFKLSPEAWMSLIQVNSSCLQALRDLPHLYFQYHHKPLLLLLTTCQPLFFQFLKSPNWKNIFQTHSLPTLYGQLLSRAQASGYSLVLIFACFHHFIDLYF